MAHAEPMMQNANLAMLDGSRTILESRSVPTQPSGDGGAWDQAPTLDVGLVNNMPDSVLRRTELQFSELLQEAAGSQFKVRLHLLAIPEVARGKLAALDMTDRYQNVNDLDSMRLDALIVTGAEPKAGNLSDESYWAAMTRLVDWAENSVSSTIWSCLAAHAAVKHIDNIERRRVEMKRVGVFDCEVQRGHPLVSGLSSNLWVPHSRYNELAESELLRAGYSILTRSKVVGVDMFAKHRKRSLFVFFQGHPEYGPTSLWREYRRDITRFLFGERSEYPIMPLNYFNLDDMQKCRAFEAQATELRNPTLVSAIPEIDEPLRQTSCWRDSAVLIYRNWLQEVAHLQPRLLSSRMTEESR